MYIGRFAPSPTGNVHFGTLVAAVASYLQAKTKQGHWLLRIDDIDTTRTVQDSDHHIIRTLESYGFEWFGDIYYQTCHLENYQKALQQLIDKDLVFPCLCSRKQLAESSQTHNEAHNDSDSNANTIYPGSCRSRRLPEAAEHSIRLHSQDINIKFHDKVMGAQQQNIQDTCGDFIIKRRDGLFAYQLAVVVDDALQGITEVVRGADLLNSTPRQIYLQQQLGYSQPSYLHLPLATDAEGNKLSKSTAAASIEHIKPTANLAKALVFLGQNPPENLANSSIAEIWSWAIEHWNISSIAKAKTITIR